MTIWAAKYVGLPFLDQGRDFKGVDCWGLVRLVLWEERQVVVPTYGDTSALDLETVARTLKREAFAFPWIAVMPNAIQPLDVAVMFRRKTPIHVGIMVTCGDVLHIEEKTAAVIVPLSHPTISFRYPLFFRHRELANERAA
jgi:cell wall-associated NlpC family hydrolase